MSETRRTFCRNCGAHCGLVLEIEGNEIVALRGDRNNPISRGYFCPKAFASRERQNGRNRLPGSLKKHEGAHRPIATQAALDEVGERLGDLLERWGPRAVGLYYGTGAYGSTLAISFAKSWLKSIGSPQLYSSQTIDQSPKNITALRMGAFTSGRQPFETADVWLISGSNPLVSHYGGWGAYTMYAPGAHIRAAKARGLKLIVIDPRLTETARLADIHLQPKPGQDVAIYAGMLHVLFREELIDRAFCDRYAVNTAALRAAVARYAPDYAAHQAGVPATLLVSAALTFGRAARGCATSGTGPDMAPHANLAAHLLECMNALCGRYRRAGEAVLNPGILSSMPVREGVFGAYPIWEHSPKMASHPDVGWSLPNEFPTNLLADEILHQGDDRLRALIVMGGEPLAAIPGTPVVRRAFDRLELLVTLECRMSETARAAHYVIACKTPYERADLGAMTDMNSPFPAAQYTEAVLEAPEGAVEEWEVFYGLSKRLARPLEWEFCNFGAPASGAKMNLDLSRKPAVDDLFDFICRRPAAPFAAIKRGAVGQVLELAPEFVQPREPGDVARLDLLPSEVAAELDECFANRQCQQLAAGELLLHSRRLLSVMNSNFVDASQSLAANPLYMHPSDMEARSLSAGDIVEVRSSAGVVRAPVQPDSTERQGAVSIHHAWPGISTDGGWAPVGALIDRDSPLEAHNHVPRMSAIPVTVQRVSQR